MSDATALCRLRAMQVAAVTAIVATRVYTGLFPQSVDMPALLFQFVDDVPTGHLRGGNSLRRSRVQATMAGATRAQAVALDQALYGDGAGSALAYWRGGIGSPAVQVSLAEPFPAQEDFVPGELREFRVLRDYMVHHR